MYYNKASTEDITCATNLMAELFANVEYGLCSAAVRKVIARDSAFPPSMGELLAACDSISSTIKMCMISPEESSSERVPIVQQYVLSQASKLKQEMLGAVNKTALN